MSAKLYFAENTIKIVFSAEHSFCVSQIVKPLFQGKTQNGTFGCKSATLGFPRACWNPYFCSAWWLRMGTKKDHFPKTESCNENARFFHLPNTNIVCLVFVKMSFLQKISFLFTTTPKFIFWAFLKLSFSMFFIFSLFLSPTSKKRQKQKVHIFFRIPFFTPWQTAKNIFLHTYTLFVFFKMPQNTLKLGKTSKTILDQALTQPWTKLWLKKTKSWTKFWLYNTYKYIHIYIHTCSPDVLEHCIAILAFC